MKKFRLLTIGVTVAVALTLGACGSDADDDDSNGENPVIETPSTVAP